MTPSSPHCECTFRSCVCISARTSDMRTDTPEGSRLEMNGINFLDRVKAGHWHAQQTDSHQIFHVARRLSIGFEAELGDDRSVGGRKVVDVALDAGRRILARLGN